MGLKTITYWTIKRPVMTILALIFHAGFIVGPLFLSAHVIVIKNTFGLDFPSLPQGLAHGITIAVIMCLFFFVVRRLAIKKIRVLTRPADYGLLLIAAAPFVTGFLTHHSADQISGNYSLWLILHILSGEIMLAALFASICFFILRYLKTKLASRIKLPYRLLVVIVFISCLVLTGFVTQPEGWNWPANSLVSMISANSSFKLIADIHFFIVLAGIALFIPMGFLRHVPAATLNLLYRPGKPMGSLGVPSKDQIGVCFASDFSWKQQLDADACVSCGKCIENCPAVIAGKPLSPRNILQKVFNRIEKDDADETPLAGRTIAEQELWSCTTCMACVRHCPVCADPAGMIIDIRRHETMGEGNLPAEVRPMIRNLELFGDTYGKGQAYRTDWIHDNRVPVLSKKHPQTDILLWVGCSGAFHPRYTQVYRSMVKILNHAKVDFAILGKKESCCGDQARRLGHESLFFELAAKNTNEISKYRFQKIVTLCPHCMHSLKHEYPGIGDRFDVMHASELVESLIDENKIQFTYPLESAITIHDPCYLGRVNQMTQSIRNISTAVGGTRLQEMDNCGENGFCCGAGGGHMWLHDTDGRHINHIRAEQVIESGADTVVTACPFCLTMLDDGISAAQTGKLIAAVDVIEMAAASIGRGE